MIDETETASAARQIAAGFCLETPRSLVTAAQGAMGRVWRLDTESGAFAVKESLWPDDPDSLRTQLELSACVCDQAHDAGVRVPRVRRTEGGSLLLSVYGSPGGELTPVRVATWIEGKPCDRTLAGRDAAEWLGSTLATLECLPDPPTPPTQPWLGSWFTHAPDTNEWQSLVRRGEREHAAWAPALAHQLTALVELGQLVGSAEDGLTVTHTDLQPANVLVTDDGYALLDWDDVGSVSRNRTLARAINDWHLHGAEIDVDGIRRTVTAYRAGGGMGIVREPRDFGDVIAGFLNYLRGQADVSLDQSHGRADAQDASNRVVAMLEHPLNLSVVLRLLAVVRSL